MEGLNVRYSSFRDLKTEGAIVITSLSSKFVCSQSIFINCFHASFNGGAIQVISTNEKNVTRSCFLNCKTLTEQIGSYKDSGQAFSLEGSKSCCFSNVVFKCAEVANQNFDPINFDDTDVYCYNENITYNACYSRSCIGLISCNFQIKYNQFFNNSETNTKFGHFYSLYKEGTCSFCNILHIKTGTLLFHGLFKVNNCCIYDYGSLNLGFTNDGTNHFDDNEITFKVANFGLYCTLKEYFDKNNSVKFGILKILIILF